MRETEPTNMRVYDCTFKREITLTFKTRAKISKLEIKWQFSDCFFYALS